MTSRRQMRCVGEPGGAARRAGHRPGLSQSFGVCPALSMRAPYAPPNRRWPMILNALVEKLKRRSKDDFNPDSPDGLAWGLLGVSNSEARSVAYASRSSPITVGAAGESRTSRF